MKNLRNILAGLTVVLGVGAALASNAAMVTVAAWTSPNANGSNCSTSSTQIDEATVCPGSGLQCKSGSLYYFQDSGCDTQFAME